ncbi:MAG: hypothetical protein OEM41_06765 [Ignavibacteria bacterium]|nr:hypothetical protein [Ignavibacteria bacterium]
MLEAETARILSVAQGRTIGDRPAIRLKEVLGADIPKGIKAHVAAEVADWLGADIRATEHVRRLDPESAAIPQILKAFLRSLATEYVFAREEFLATLSGGVHLAGNYLCRPQETLAQFVFGEGDRVTYNELFMRLDHFADYAYLTTLIDNYVVRKGRKEITLTEFRTAISRLDERVVREHNPRELTRLLKPLFDFILLANLDRRGTIPLPPLLAFFEDKKMFILREYIERICVIRGKTVLSREELTAIIEDLYEDEKPKETPRTQLQVPVHQPVPASKEESDEEEENLEERSASPLVEEVEDEREDPDENKPEPFVDIPEEESAPVSSPEAHDTGGGPVDPSQESHQQLLPDLNTIITEDQRSRFVKKIFRKDDTYYDTIIQALNAAPTWKEASQNLNHLFQINNLDPFSGIVVEFTDAIYARYAPSNKSRS